MSWGRFVTGVSPLGCVCSRDHLWLDVCCWNQLPSLLSRQAGRSRGHNEFLRDRSGMGLLPDTKNYGLRTRRELRERFPRHHGLAIPTCITAHAWCMPGSLTSRFLWSRWRRKRSRHSRLMRNPQFYVSGKRPMQLTTLSNFLSQHVDHSWRPVGLNAHGVNPLRATFFRNNINIFLHLMSFLHTSKTQVVEIPPRVRQGPAYST